VALGRHIGIRKPGANSLRAGHKEIVEVDKEVILAAATAITLKNQVRIVHLQWVSLKQAE
jgi:hypothetical protein